MKGTAQELFFPAKNVGEGMAPDTFYSTEPSLFQKEKNHRRVILLCKRMVASAEGDLHNILKRSS
jgi:hypothetical protein